MIDPSPITGEELEEMKACVMLCDEAAWQKKPEQVVEFVRAMGKWFPRCIAEIERLKAENGVLHSLISE